MILVNHVLPLPQVQRRFREIFTRVVCTVGEHDRADRVVYSDTHRPVCVTLSGLVAETARICAQCVAVAQRFQSRRRRNAICASCRETLSLHPCPTPSSTSVSARRIRPTAGCP